MKIQVLLSVAALLCLASSPALSKDCALPKPTEINIKPKTKPVKHDFSKKLADIQISGLDTINPYTFHSRSYTQGFMKGAIRMDPSVKLSGFTKPGQGTACLWYNKIDINIEIDPTIVLAKEIAADSCTKRAVLEHEMKHIYADREIVNKYAKIMGDKVYAELKKRGGFVVGPIPISRKEEVSKRMQDTVFQILEREYRRMEIDRQDIQSGIDTLEEYERVNAQCPDSQRKFSKALHHAHSH